MSTVENTAKQTPTVATATEPEHLDLRSEDIVADKQADLLQLFPEARTEGGKIDFDRLRLAIGQTLDVGKERYGMNWPGKADCFRTIQAPSMGTLRPCPDESVHFDTTENLIIEGDNLEVLKLLQKAYLGKVKMIYIDPPYNTGNDFIYPDNFSESLQTYLEYTGQVDAEGKKFGTNTEADGRFHSRWLNMMYPRLYLARNLLREDGTIFVSCDDNEVQNLRAVMNEVLGEENFIATVIWQKVFSPKNSAKHFSADHDYIIVYARRADLWRPELLPRTEEMEARYDNPDNDPRGPWTSGDLSARNYYSEGIYPVTCPSGRVVEGPPPGTYWRVSKEKFLEMDRDRRIWWGKEGNGTPRLKRFLSDVKQGRVPQTFWPYSEVGHTQDAKKELMEYVAFAFVRVEQIDYKKGIKAKLRIHTQTPEGPKEKSFTVKNGADLYQLSGERASYENGFVVAEINAEPANEYIRFNNGRVLRLGEESGGMRDDVWRAQIRHTVKKHLEKELQLRERGIKVLSLFFIDRVANYRDYDSAGQPVKGKFAEAFEASLAEFAKDARYAPLDWLKQPFESVHNGYFASDKKGVLKDTRGDTQADDEVYNLIMKEKERLLSEDEPLRFIFSHSALREGWDNPNVFQICTLNETRSAMKKRQEIGRGLRLPVDRNGQRVFDDSVNKLLVMANESYEDFARALQTEYEEDCGVTFGKVPLTAIARISRVVDGEEQPIGRETAGLIRDALVKQKMLDADGRIQAAFDPKKPGFKIDLPEGQRDLAPAVIDLLASYQIERHIRKDQDEGPNRLKKEVQLSPEFKALWDRIKPKTMYRVEFETETLVRHAVDAIKRMEKIEAPKIRVSIGQLDVKRGGIAATATSVSEERVSAGAYPSPDILAYLQNETELTRSTLVRILKESGRLGEFFTDPQRFMDAVASILKYELHRLLVDGIKYERIGGGGPETEWEMMLFKNEDLVSYLTALPVQHSLYEYVVYDSEIEREFARKLDQRQDIKLFVKLPSWFEIDTPVGKYNPDWAILKHDGHAMYLVRETKGTKDFLKLRTSEADKVRCGQRHFEEIGVPFAVAVTADEV